MSTTSCTQTSIKSLDGRSSIYRMHVESFGLRPRNCSIGFPRRSVSRAPISDKWRIAFSRSVLPAHESRLAEQAFDEIDRELAGLIALVEGGIELDDVERA